MASYRRGISFALLAMICFASMDAASKHLTASYSIVQIVWVRYLFFAALSLAMARSEGVAATLRSPYRGLQIVRSLVLVGEVASFVLAFSYLPLGYVHSVAAVTPLMTLAMAALFLKESVGARRWGAVAIGFVGVLLIIRPREGIAGGWVALIPLLAAFLWALYQILVRAVSRTDSTNTTFLYTGLTGAAVTTLVAPFEWVAPDTEGWLLLVLVGLLGTFAHLCLIKALHAAPTSVLQPFNYTLVVWASFMGFLVFGDVPDAWTMLGAAIVIGGGLYSMGE
jgi:drug/metabolite transporter (DMT)-like permease